MNNLTIHDILVVVVVIEENGNSRCFLAHESVFTDSRSAEEARKVVLQQMLDNDPSFPEETLCIRSVSDAFPSVQDLTS